MGWQEEVEHDNDCTFGLDCTSWPPQIGGVMVGISQLPLVLTLTQCLGSSSQYQFLASKWMYVALAAGAKDSVDKTSKYQAFFQVNFWWQFVFGMGAILGAFSSA